MADIISFRNDFASTASPKKNQEQAKWRLEGIREDTLIKSSFFSTLRDPLKLRLPHSIQILGPGPGSSTFSHYASANKFIKVHTTRRCSTDRSHAPPSLFI